MQNAFSALKESISPYTDTPDETYNELTLKFKNELIAEGTKVYPSFTHGTALPWSASTSLQTQIQEFATSAEHDAEYFANRIVNILKEAGVKGELRSYGAGACPWRRLWPSRAAWRLAPPLPRRSATSSPP